MPSSSFTLPLLTALVTFDSLHVGFAMLESFRVCFPSLYPDFLLAAFPFFHFPLYRVTLCASIYMTVAVAVERYLAVCFPHDYQSMRARANRYVMHRRCPLYSTY